REQGAGSREQGAGSREQGAGSREQGAGSREQGAGSREYHKCLTYSTFYVFSKNFIKRLLRLNRCVLAISVVFVKIFILKSLRCNNFFVYAANSIIIQNEVIVRIATFYWYKLFKHRLYMPFMAYKDGAFFGTLHCSITNYQLRITADALVVSA
ncbi:MAG: hypothetical protein LBQ31_07810, partial [Bacteroidales bacterium]|nr:hypothetical protein [Bacteroidales bacterium]